MRSVAAGEQDVAARLAGLRGGACVAAVNGPGAVTVSGERAVLEELAARCEAEGVRARMLPVDYASHSPQVEELEEELAGLLAGLAPAEGSVPFYSSVTGGLLHGT